MLLEFGAEPTIAGHPGHDALYYAANALIFGRAEEGRAVVERLIQQGADVNRQSRPGGVTPLHMAARRGNVEIAEALLAAGAATDLRDTKGDTPLQRARNCRKEAVIRLLEGRSRLPSPE